MVGNRNKGNDRDAYISIKYNTTAWQQRLRTSEADEKNVKKLGRQSEINELSH